MTYVRHGDKHPITLTVNTDLTGATVEAHMRRQNTTALIPFPVTVTNPPEGELTHTLAGDLPVGVYELEVEVTTGDEVRTYPSQGSQTLRVLPTIA